jgi:sec-independent protein translocase protein TatA
MEAPVSNLKPTEILIILLVLLLLFGARRLPDLARSVGQSVRVFRKEVKETKAEISGADPAE